MNFRGKVRFCRNTTPSRETVSQTPATFRLASSCPEKGAVSFLMIVFIRLRPTARCPRIHRSPALRGSIVPSSVAGPAPVVAFYWAPSRPVLGPNFYFYAFITLTFLVYYFTVPPRDPKVLARDTDLRRAPESPARR